jgi:hypothetical protein
MAGSKTKPVLWVLALCALSSAALAQRTAQSTAATSTKPVAEATSSRLLTTDEGLTIIGAALESSQLKPSNPDCSHIVHAIYKRAGFPYSYADSFQLYDGVEGFQQVVHPQPGDLVVWRGHAAIVVNPAQHTFFGSTSSGLRVESYDSEYWQHRGRPRFFRYVKSAPPLSLTATRASTTDLSSQRNAEARTRIAESGDSGDLPASDVQSSAPPGSFPRVLAVHVRRPNAKQLNEALSRCFDEIDRGLRNRNVLKLAQTLIVFDHIEVTGVHLKGRQGWVDVKIDGFSSLVAGRATPKKQAEQQRWVLTRRDAETWELLPPQKTTYLPRDLAVRALSHQLASLADRTSEAGDSQDQKQLARALNLILEK